MRKILISIPREDIRDILIRSALFFPSLKLTETILRDGQQETITIINNCIIHIQPQSSRNTRVVLRPLNSPVIKRLVGITVKYFWIKSRFYPTVNRYSYIQTVSFETQLSKNITVLFFNEKISLSYLLQLFYFRCLNFYSVKVLINNIKSNISDLYKCYANFF